MSPSDPTSARSYKFAGSNEPVESDEHIDSNDSIGSHNSSGTNEPVGSNHVSVTNESTRSIEPYELGPNPLDLSNPMNLSGSMSLLHVVSNENGLSNWV